MAKSMRAVIVYDVELDGSTRDAAKLDEALENFAANFQKHIQVTNPELAKKVNFSQTTSAVPLAERRGPTGSLDDIVFRGSRGPNIKIAASIPKGSSPSMRAHLIRLRNAMAKDGLPPDLVQENLNLAHEMMMGEGEPEVIKFDSKTGTISKAAPRSKGYFDPANRGKK